MPAQPARQRKQPHARTGRSGPLGGSACARPGKQLLIHHPGALLAGFRQGGPQLVGEDMGIMHLAQDALQLLQLDQDSPCLGQFFGELFQQVAQSLRRDARGVNGFSIPHRADLPQLSGQYQSPSPHSPPDAGGGLLRAGLGAAAGADLAEPIPRSAEPLGDLAARARVSAPPPVSQAGLQPAHPFALPRGELVGLGDPGLPGLQIAALVGRSRQPAQSAPEAFGERQRGPERTQDAAHSAQRDPEVMHRIGVLPLCQPAAGPYQIGQEAPDYRPSRAGSRTLEELLPNRHLYL
ncbi:MAG TPA: hypothetical protein VGQ69_07945 [Gemmatimonadales bacterium]|nr:hypothetical protein [Gemmatimonadales bacterium]